LPDEAGGFNNVLFLGLVGLFGGEDIEKVEGLQYSNLEGVKMQKAGINPTLRRQH
jgi:hypothetical protein